MRYRSDVKNTERRRKGDGFLEIGKWPMGKSMRGDEEGKGK